MLARAKNYPVFGGAQTVRVVDAEDVIGLKVQAMVNDPDRRVQEMADIEQLMGSCRERLDWKRVQEYYDLFNRAEEGKQLKKRYGHAE